MISFLQITRDVDEVIMNQAASNFPTTYLVLTPTSLAAHAHEQKSSGWQNINAKQMAIIRTWFERGMSSRTRKTLDQRTYVAKATGLSLRQIDVSVLNDQACTNAYHQ